MAKQRESRGEERDKRDEKKKNESSRATNNNMPCTIKKILLRYFQHNYE
jgi:hypothetical protein